mmetsp:Transcript_72404/g.157207  ORF Transcript_72404/g.157207 Transcript_72404/m.157207 type:complete len:94 (-) Transcript_72404:28-309(-)
MLVGLCSLKEWLLSRPRLGAAGERASGTPTEGIGAGGGRRRQTGGEQQQKERSSLTGAETLPSIMTENRTARTVPGKRERVAITAVPMTTTTR